MRKGFAKVYLTANFERNLVSIGEFLAAADASLAFDALIERLSGELIPTLERFPELGADFTGRAPLSVEGRALFERLVELAGDGEVRQLIEGDYVDPVSRPGRLSLPAFDPAPSTGVVRLRRALALTLTLSLIGSRAIAAIAAPGMTSGVDVEGMGYNSGSNMVPRSSP